MISPPAKNQTGILNLFIEPPPPQIFGCNTVADENAMRNYSCSIIGSSTKDLFPEGFSALGRVTCQPSICPWLGCRARFCQPVKTARGPLTADQDTEAKNLPTSLL